MMFSTHAVQNMVRKMWEEKPTGAVSMAIRTSPSGECISTYFTKEGNIGLLDAMLPLGDCVINPEHIWEVENPAGGTGFLFPLQDRVLKRNMLVNPMCVGYGKLVSANIAIFTTDDDVVAKARDFSTKCGVVIEEEVEEKKPKKKNPKKVVRKTKTTKKD